MAARMPADPDRSTCLRRAWTLHSRQIGIINKKLCYEKLACMPADLCVIFLFLLHSLLQIAWCGGRLVRLHRLCARRGKVALPSSFYVGGLQLFQPYPVPSVRFSCSTTGGYALARGLLSSSVVVFTLVGSFVITHAFRSRLRLWLVVVLLAPWTAAGVGSPFYCVNFCC